MESAKQTCNCKETKEFNDKITKDRTYGNCPLLVPHVQEEQQ